uniref:Uncharacterized protein n=1 Tax=Solanum lycopersicum TaxID=4081 RepID=A0A3Q7EJQ2_SOLLC
THIFHNNGFISSSSSSCFLEEDGDEKLLIMVANSWGWRIIRLERPRNDRLFLISRIHTIVSGNTEVPDAMEMIFQSALALG